MISVIFCFLAIVTPVFFVASNEADFIAFSVVTAVGLQILGRYAALIVAVFLSVLQVANFLRLGEPVYYLQIYSFFNDPLLAISMVNGMNNNQIYIPLFILIVIFVAGLITKEQKQLNLSYKLGGLSVFIFAIFSAANNEKSIPLAIKIPASALSLSITPHIKNREEPSSPLNDKSYTNIVFLVGESISSEVVNYPKVEQAGALWFKDVTALGTFTASSLNNLLLLEPRGSSETKPTLFMYAKSAGYRTTFASSRNAEWGGFKSKLSQGLDEILDINDFTDTYCSQICSLLSSMPDYEIEDHLLSTLSEPSSKNFYVWHMDMAHQPYNRYKGATTYIEMVDLWLDRVFNLSKLLPADTLIIATSDHGALHNESSLRVPLIFISDKSLYSSNTSDASLSHNDLVSTIIDVMGFSESHVQGINIFSERQIENPKRFYDSNEGFKQIAAGNPMDVMKDISLLK